MSARYGKHLDGYAEWLAIMTYSVSDRTQDRSFPATCTFWTETEFGSLNFKPRE